MMKESGAYSISMWEAWKTQPHSARAFSMNILAKGITTYPAESLATHLIHVLLPSILPNPFPRGSRPCSSWLLNARPILPPTTPGSSLGPTLSTLLECSFLFSSSFGSTATRLTKQHSAHSAGFPGALQSGLNSYPCPIQLAPALSKNLNGKWWLSANPYPSKSRVKEKTRQNYSTTAEIRLGLGYDAALTWARHCARCGCEHCLL